MVTRIEMQLVCELVERRDLAIGAGIEDRKFPDLDGANAIALRLEFRQGGAGAGRLRAVGLGCQG
jgi:hypothetical protein